MKNKSLNKWIIAAVFIMSCSLCFLTFSMKEPVKMKDEDRISVRFDTDVLVESLKDKKDEWGTVDTDWSLKFWENEAATLTIESKPEQKFNKVFLKDSAAYKIAEDYPHLYTFDVDEEGDCVFTMKREQGKENYVLLPTWLLVELLDARVLECPK